MMTPWATPTAPALSIPRVVVELSVMERESGRELRHRIGVINADTSCERSIWGECLQEFPDVTWTVIIGIARVVHVECLVNV